MRATRRVLITGSRRWGDRSAVWAVLDEEWMKAVEAGETLMVVHGKCPTGADLYAHTWCENAWLCGVLHVDEEPHPPKGIFRGELIRNQQMAESGVVVCHAFPHEGSTGTRHCMSRSFAAGVHVENHGWQPYTKQAKDFAEAYG